MWKRSISILRPSPTTVIPSNVLSGSQLDAKPLFEDKDSNSNTTNVQLLGDNPTLASLTVSASIPVYVNSKCLVSIHDSNKLSNVSISGSKWFSLWPTLSLTRFNRLIGAEQFHCLISSKNTKDSLSLLQLDGTHDWIVFDPNSIVSFERNASLNIDWYHKWLNYWKWMTNKISLFPCYGKVSGRGSVVLNGHGSVYKIELQSEEEQILLQKNRLLALNGLSKLDFRKAVTFEQHTKTIVKYSHGKDNKPYDKIFAWIKERLQPVKNSDFVRIRGPRTVLIQTGTVGQNLGIWPNSTISLKPAKNYLSFASFKDGKIQFKNTQSFLEK